MQGIESIHRDVVKSFPNLTVGMDVLKQVRTQMLLYWFFYMHYTRSIRPIQCMLHALHAFRT